jgi:hypothetical protein
MGYYYEPSESPPDEKPPGCLDALVIMRVVFSVILPVVLAMIVVLVDVAVIVTLYARHPALALIPIAITAVGVWLYARWEQRRFRPPGL